MFRRPGFLWSKGIAQGEEIMKRKSKCTIRTGSAFVVAVCIAVGLAAPAHASELDELKAQIQAMNRNMAEMQKKIDRLERENQQQKQQTAAARTAAPGPKAVHGGVSGTTTTTTAAWTWPPRTR